MNTTWILRAVLVFSLLLTARTSMAEGLSSTDKNDQSKRPASKSAPEPSTLQKMNSGVKNFFTKTGKALTPKKSEPTKKAINPYQSSKINRSTSSSSQKKDENKSWFGSMFKKQEPPKQPQTPSEWLGLKRLDP